MERFYKRAIMKNINVTLAGITLAVISGCSSDIDTIREGRLQNLPEYTVSQALDNREICQDTDWSTLKDDKGRNIVRYKCEMKGIEEWYYDLAQELVNSETYTISEISSIKNKIESLRSKLIQFEDDQNEFTKLSRKNQSQGGLNRKDNQKYTQLFFNRRERSNSISKLKSEINPLETHYERMNKSNDNRATGEYILKNYKGSAAYETIDWLVLEDGSFMPLGGNLHEIQPGDDDFSEIPTPDIEAAIYAIYESEVESYFDYKQAIGIPL